MHDMKSHLFKLIYEYLSLRILPFYGELYFIQLLLITRFYSRYVIVDKRPLLD